MACLLYLATVQPIIVSDLIVESVTGATCYPDEGGFSALTAYVRPDDPAIIDQLRRAANEGASVIVRCAKLEVEGRVGKLQVSIGGMKGAIAISIDELRYFKHGRKD
jgi:hypothetical protein